MLHKSNEPHAEDVTVWYVWEVQPKTVPNEITTHSLVAGEVLCRWWGDEPPPEAKIIEDALNKWRDGQCDE